MGFTAFLSPKSDLRHTRRGWEVVPLRELGKGGMARVLLALRRGPGFERLCVIKRLHAHHQEDPAFHQMLFDEARIAGLVRHPNVVSVFDVGEDDAGPFLLMEFVEGIHLGTLISSVVDSGDLVPISVALEIAYQVALGLDAVHELRASDGSPLHLVHRDVSPQNILIGFDGVVRVTDFGIAKAWGRQTRTTTGILKGKAGYLSPEQLRFEDPDRRSDLFSFGVVLTEMILGCRLYLGRDANETARRVLNTPPVDISEHRGDAPPALVDLCFSLLAQNREARPPTAATVARELERIRTELTQEGNALSLRSYLDEHFSEARSRMQTFVEKAIEDTGPSLALTAPRRNRWLVASAAIAVSALAGALWFAWAGITDKERPETATAAEPTTPQVHVAALDDDPAPDTGAPAPETNTPDVSEAPPDAEIVIENPTSAETARPRFSPAARRARARRLQRRARRRRSEATAAENSAMSSRTPTKRPSSRFWGWP